MNIRDVMEATKECVGLQETIAAATATLERYHARALPICDHGRPVGVLTQLILQGWTARRGSGQTVRRVGELLESAAVVVDVASTTEWTAAVLDARQERYAVVLENDRVIGVLDRERLAEPAAVRAL